DGRAAAGPAPGGGRARRAAGVALAGVVVVGLASGAAVLTREEPAQEPPAVAASPAPGSTAPTPTASAGPASATSVPATSSGLSASATGEAPAGEALQDLLDDLAEGRTAALADPRPDRLTGYAAAGGPAWERDRAIQEELAAGGYAFSGLVVRLSAEGDAVDAVSGRLTVPARLTMSPHTVLDETGAVVDEVPGSEEDVLLTLVRQGTGWLVHAVDPR
ncbi:MAG: hypothetical protein Q4D18_10000, partial [Micrococcus sp.]|nr:hypothetical protein [Micrococcus sp.]